MGKRIVLISESELVKTITNALFSGLKPDTKDTSGGETENIDVADDTTTTGDEKISLNVKDNKGTTFNQMAELVVNNIEGGYYHPQAHKNVPNISRMGKSGETMYGLDRKWGPNLPNFWKKVDELNPSKTSWKYNETLKDKPEIANQLKNMLYPEMKRLYEEYSNKYLSTKSKEIIQQNPSIMFHFVYATWNGSGFFKKWATSFNNEVKNGNTDPKSLENFVINQRMNSAKMIASTAPKVEKIMDTLA